MSDQKTALQWKEEGNDAFNKGEWDKAIKCYTKAILLAKEDNVEKAVYLKNRAAAYLKKNNSQAAVQDCSAALEIVPNDPKALFRRCQGYENLAKFEEAYQDARHILSVDPANKAIQPCLARLHAIVQARAIEMSQTSNKVEKMMILAFDFGEDREKREQAINNLVVLARESSGADVMFQKGIVKRVESLLKVEKNKTIFIAGVRIVGELCKDSVPRTKSIINDLGIPWFLDILNCQEEDQVNASQYCLQTIINVLSGMTHKPESKPVAELCEANKKEIDTLLTCLVFTVTSRTISGLARDAIIELVIRNCHYETLNWAFHVVQIRGLQRLMEVGSELKEFKYESSMEITDSTRTLISVCLARIYENMYYDQARQEYLTNISDYIKGRLITPDHESKVRAVVALTTLLLGPLDVGNSILAKDGMMEMILVMANTDDLLQQKVACECIIAASSKKDKVKAIITQGVNILKKLCQSKDDGIRVRALVGLCKLGSSGGTDASIRPFADGATTKLADACRRFLVNPDKDQDMRRWAAEGLSYLTLDAEVKEKLISDGPALRALIELAKTGNQAAVYDVVVTLVNLCNAYEKQEIIPEIVELAELAKHHVPEEHKLDDPDFLNKRIDILAHEGVISAFVALSKTGSHNTKELIARIFNAICSQQHLRGIVVQQGGAKVLLPMSLEGTDKGKKQAAQALARIGITMNPEVAFPGQRCLEVIRPLLTLLHPECSALENFEGLMALCNLAAVSETVRLRIIKEQGVQKIESYMFEEHEMLRRAAVQVMTNLIVSPDVIKLYEDENDRTKFLLLLCGEEDVDTSISAAGALAHLTAASKKCCKKIVKTQAWLEMIHILLGNPNKDIQYRGVYIVNNLMRSSKSVAEKLIETDIMEILMALSLQEGEDTDKIKKYALLALEGAEEWKLIKKPGEENGENENSDGE